MVWFNKQTWLNKQVFAIISLLIAWHVVSATNNILAKVVLENFNYPLTVTLVQFFLTTFLTWPLLSFGLVGTSKKYNAGLSIRYWLVWLVPLAVAKIITTTSSQWSIAKLSVSYVHTVKASMPIFAVIFLRLIFKKKQTLLIYLSLLPIITGVGVASWSEDSFNILGFASALIATCGFTLQHIFNKSLLEATNIHSFKLVLITGQLSLLLFAPIWVATDLRVFTTNFSAFGSFSPDPTHCWKVAGLLLADGILCFLQNILAFVFLSKVAPLTYSVANATKRIEIIVVSIMILKNHVTLLNCIGMGLALTGVLVYTYAKHTDNQKKRREQQIDNIVKETSGDEENPLSIQPENNNISRGTNLKGDKDCGEIILPDSEFLRHYLQEECKKEGQICNALEVLPRRSKTAAAVTFPSQAVPCTVDIV